MKKTQGFTLVELAIVLVIIGLILGAVMKGQELILNAKLKKVVKQAQAAVAASQTFNDYTMKWPGGIVNAGTDLCSMGIVRLVDKYGNAYCSALNQKAFEFWGYNSGGVGNLVKDRKGTIINEGLWLDGIGTNTQGAYSNSNAEALFVVFHHGASLGEGIVCFMQDAFNAKQTTTEAQRKAMLAIATTFAGSIPYIGVNCVAKAQYNACIGDWSEVAEGSWETQGSFTPASTIAQRELEVCIRIKQ